MMTSKNLKRRLKELRVEEEYFRDQFRRGKDSTSEETKGYLRLCDEIRWTTSLLDANQNVANSIIDFTFCLVLSSNILQIQYDNPWKSTIMAVVSFVYICLVVKESRQLAQDIHHLSIPLWMLNNKDGNLSDWYYYIKQVDRKLMKNGIYFMIWLCPSLFLNMYYDLFDLVDLLAILTFGVSFYLQYRGSCFNVLDDFYDVARKIQLLN